MGRLLDLAEGQWGLFTRQQAQLADVGPSTLARLARDELLERVAHGVYRLRGGPPTDHLELKAAWLQLDSGMPAWERVLAPGLAVVSHQSAARLHGIDIGPDQHEFTVPLRRQTRRADVRLRRGIVPGVDWLLLDDLPVTTPARLVLDLLIDWEDPHSVAPIAAAILQEGLDTPAGVAECIAPLARRYGFRRGAGQALLELLLEAPLSPSP